MEKDGAKLTFYPNATPHLLFTFSNFSFSLLVFYTNNDHFFIFVDQFCDTLQICQLQSLPSQS